MVQVEAGVARVGRVGWRWCAGWQAETGGRQAVACLSAEWVAGRSQPAASPAVLVPTPSPPVPHPASHPPLCASPSHAPPPLNPAASTPLWLPTRSWAAAAPSTKQSGSSRRRGTTTVGVGAVCITVYSCRLFGHTSSQASTRSTPHCTQPHASHALAHIHVYLLSHT